MNAKELTATRAFVRTEGHLLSLLHDLRSIGDEGTIHSEGYVEYSPEGLFSMLTDDGLVLAKHTALGAAIAWAEVEGMAGHAPGMPAWQEVLYEVFPLLAVTAAALRDLSHDVVYVEGEPVWSTSVTLGLRRIIETALERVRAAKHAAEQEEPTHV